MGRRRKSGIRPWIGIGVSARWLVVEKMEGTDIVEEGIGEVEDGVGESHRGWSWW
jgi:outer membrane protein W